MSRSIAMVHRSAALLALLIVSACGGSPAAPASPGATPGSSLASSIDGTWEGEWQWTGCAGHRQCMFMLKQTEPFLLTVQQIGTSVEGIVVTTSMVADVHGTQGADGQWLLTGFTPHASDKDNHGSVDVRQLALRVDPAGLTGAINFQVRPGPASDAGRSLSMIDYSGSIVSARRGPPPAGPQWAGQYVVRGCTTIGWAFCSPREDRELGDVTLHLDAAGTGELSIQGFTVPVRRASAGSDVVFGEAVAHEPRSGGQSELRLTSFTARPDKFGRLRGTLAFTNTFRADDGRLLSTSYDAELWQVINLRPGQ